MKHLVKPLLLAVAAFAFLSPPANAQEKWKEVYSNVTVKDSKKLFRNVAFVGKFAGDSKHRIFVQWFGKDGTMHSCSNWKGKWYYNESAFAFVNFNAKKKKIKYPRVEFGDDGRKKSFFTIRYEPDGALTYYIYSKRFWRKGSFGHLQKRLPAALWTACKDFPSAESLGAKINDRQISTNYMELLTQDPGNRIKQPKLITEDTVERY